MPRLARAVRRRLSAGTAGTVLALGLSACSGAPRPARLEVDLALVQGPTHWLMLPEEQEQARRLHGVPDRLAFEEQFWKRRDPDPATPGNELLQEFNQRVDAADRLYQEGIVRGSLSDRGRALVILGAPPILRYSQRQVPTWEPGRSGGEPNVQSRTVQVETWVYRMTDLPPSLAEAFRREGYESEIEIAFAAGPERTTITSGEKLLEIAVRAAARE